MSQFNCFLFQSLEWFLCFTSGFAMCSDLGYQIAYKECSPKLINKNFLKGSSIQLDGNKHMGSTTEMDSLFSFLHGF